jgi:hypothetical protein
LGHFAKKFLKIEIEVFLNFKVHILGENIWGYLPPKVWFQAILREGALKKLLRRILG